MLTDRCAGHSPRQHKGASKPMQQSLLTASSCRTPCASGALSSAAWLTLRAYMSLRRFTARLVVSPPAGEWAAGPALPPQALPEGCRVGSNVKPGPGAKHIQQGGCCVCTAQALPAGVWLLPCHSKHPVWTSVVAPISAGLQHAGWHDPSAGPSSCKHTDSHRPPPKQPRRAHLDPGRQGAERLPHKGPHQLLVNGCIPCSLAPAQ